MRPLLFICAAFALFSAPALFLRFGFPTAWRNGLSRIALAGYGAVLASMGLYFYFRIDAPDHARLAVIFAYVIVLAGFNIVVSALAWAPLMAWHNRRNKKQQTIDPARRALLLQSAKAIPAASILLSPAGVKASMNDPVVRPIQIPIADLPKGLEGLKILQLTDVHLGLHIEPEQFEKIAKAAAHHKPDLVVLTGDIADDYQKLGPALDYLKILSPPLGVYACIGNHEIYRGRDEAEAIYKERGIKFLCNNGKRIEYRGEQFWLAGADDPARLFRKRSTFYKKTIQNSLQDRPEDISLSILLCHRPQGFDAAVKLGVDLTLSGHTHGGQVAIAGRSLFEPFMPRSYLLGHYQEGKSHLYTSAGLGHWLPFRLNCPCEGALLELTKAPST